MFARKVRFVLTFRKDSGKISFMKISEGFPKLLEEGGVTAKIYKSFIKDKYDLFTLAYYMDGKFLKENFGQLDDAIARGKKVKGFVPMAKVFKADR